MKGAELSLGAHWQLLAQFGNVVAQAGYAAITARVFLPELFGAFALSLILVGLTGTLTGAFVPLLMREEQLSQLSLGRIRRANLLVALPVGALLALTIGPFCSLLGHPDGEVFAAPLAVAAVLSAIANVEAGALRRQRGSKADSLALSLSFVGGIVVATPLVLLNGSAWTLTANLLASPLLLVLSVAALRPQNPRLRGEPTPWTTISWFVSRASAQNVGFVGMSQLPMLFVGQTSTSAQLGNFARASTMSQIPGLAVGNAMIRTLQPFWRLRHQAEHPHVIGSVANTVALGSLPLFALLAGVAPWLVELWLGPGWELAARVMAPLAIGSGYGVVLNVCVSGLEIQGRFSSIRAAQASLLLGLTAFMGFLAMGAQPDSATWVLAANPALATVVLLLTSRTVQRPRDLLVTMAVPTIVACLVGSAAFLASWLCAAWMDSEAAWSDVPAVATGGVLGLTTGAVLIRIVLRLATLSLPGARLLVDDLTGGRFGTSRPATGPPTRKA